MIVKTCDLYDYDSWLARHNQKMEQELKEWRISSLRKQYALDLQREESRAERKASVKQKKLGISLIVIGAIITALGIGEGLLIIAFGGYVVATKENLLGGQIV